MKEGKAYNNRRSNTIGIQAGDAEIPNDKETRSRRKRIRRSTTKEENAIEQKPATEIPEDVTADETYTHEKEAKRKKLAHSERDPPD